VNFVRIERIVFNFVIRHIPSSKNSTLGHFKSASPSLSDTYDVSPTKASIPSTPTTPHSNCGAVFFERNGSSNSEVEDDVRIAKRLEVSTTHLPTFFTDLAVRFVKIAVAFFHCWYFKYTCRTETWACLWTVWLLKVSSRIINLYVENSIGKKGYSITKHQLYHSLKRKLFQQLCYQYMKPICKFYFHTCRH
jgi:hypothetical protein